MSDISIIKTLTSRTIDPAIFGWPTNLLTAVAGTPTVSGGNYRLNVASFRSTFQVLYGQFSFGITVPTPPGPGDLRRWGLKGYPDTKGEAYFDLTAGVFSLNVVSDKGVSTSVVVPFDIAWPTMEIDFGISMEERSVVFTADGSIIGRIEVAIGDAITSPTYIFVDNAGADDMDVGYIKMKNVGRIVYENAPFNSITPGTGATSLGKAEDAAHTSGDVGVMALAVRNDNDDTLGGTNLDYTPFAVSAAGRLKIVGGFPEDFAHTSGDNGLFVLAVRQDTPATTEADGDYASLKIEGLKGLRVTKGSLDAGENQNRNVVITREDGERTQITTATTTVCRNTGGVVQRIIVNSAALTGDVTIYDNASTASGSTIIIKAGMLIGSHKIGWRVSNGATVVTAAADNIIIITGE